MRINTHIVPKALTTMIQSGAWRPETQLPALRRKGHVLAHSDYQFLHKEGMKADLQDHRNSIRPDSTDFFGLNSSRITGAPVLIPMCDVDMAVPIICCGGEPFIWLDYRNGACPKIIRLKFVGRRPEWEVIAKDFLDFMENALDNSNAPRF